MDINLLNILWMQNNSPLINVIVKQAVRVAVRQIYSLLGTAVTYMTDRSGKLGWTGQRYRGQL